MKYSYSIIPNDPLNLRQYQLENGLTLLLCVTDNEPRIFTNIVVKAGSKNDPSDLTGLAHYMEHLLFKGTSKIGSLHWELESEYLEKIYALYEIYRQETDPAKRKELFKEIDLLSFEAAKLAAPNEYDKLSSAIGAKHTNAYTWLDQVVYVNDIPSNELERWMQLESERFRMMALRLFHTELETVYEEFNINQDNDARKANNAMLAALFPDHTYGTQTTIGDPEHLKNPSPKRILEFFATYYVPNNMALILVGDFDPDTVVDLAIKHFGSYKAHSLPEWNHKRVSGLPATIKKEVWGKESPYITLAWRVAHTHQNLLLINLLSAILHNEQAGLLDLALNKQQKVLNAESWSWLLADYLIFGLYGKPKENQSLENLEDLLLGELEKVASGDFEEWLLGASIRNMKLEEWKAQESNGYLAGTIVNNYILGIPWQKFVERYKDFGQITKNDIAAFAQRLLKENWVVMYKRQGEDPSVVKVEKPEITPIDLNREASSSFAKTFLSLHQPPLPATFIQFEDFISEHDLGCANGLNLHYVQNKTNGLFRLDYIFNITRFAEPLLSLATSYMPYLAAGAYSESDLSREFYRLGVEFEAYMHGEETYFTLKGLEESFEPALNLMELMISEGKPNNDALRELVSDLLVKRSNSTTNKKVLLRDALSSYARYGHHSPFRSRLSAKELIGLKAEELTQKLGNTLQYRHDIYYYGQNQPQEVAKILARRHMAPDLLLPVPEKVNFDQLATLENQVYFFDFPTVQTELLLISKGTPQFSLEEYLIEDWFNEYFGSGLSSIVFQELRESKGMAYSAYAHLSSPSQIDKAHYLTAYIGTQPDKVKEAIGIFLTILNNMPVAEDQMEVARQSLLRQMESDRIKRSNIYWTARSNQKLGIRHDIRKDEYKFLQKATQTDLLQFHEKHIQGRNYVFCILGEKKRNDMPFLQSLGKFQELSLDDLFGNDFLS